MIGIAIVGTGIIAEAHIKAYLAFGNQCKILALCDIFPDKAKQQIEKYQLRDAALYPSYQDLLAIPEINLVSICTPPFTHAQIAIECLEAGKHVLVEKPMASSLTECDEMIAAAERVGRYVSIVAQNRFNPDNWKLKSILSSDFIGKPLFGQVESFWYRGPGYYDLWWRGTWEKEGGGCTLNHAIHQIDLLNWIMGPPKQMTAVVGNVTHTNSEAEDVSAAILAYENGVIVTLTSALVVHGEGQRLIFQCEKAGVASPWQAKASCPMVNGFPDPNPDFTRELQQYFDGLPAPEHAGHEGQIGDMLRCIQIGGEPVAGGLDGRLAIEVVAAIYKSAFTRVPVTLPLAEDDPFYTKQGLLASVSRFHQKKQAVGDPPNSGMTV